MWGLTQGACQEVLAVVRRPADSGIQTLLGDFNEGVRARPPVALLALRGVRPRSNLGIRSDRPIYYFQ